MHVQGTREQHGRYWGLYDSPTGIIASGTAPQLVLPETSSRASFLFQNTSAAGMWLGLGSARASATISGGVVNAVTVVNAGFNFSRAPLVRFYGGGIQPQGGVIQANASYVSGTAYGFPSPSHPALAHCVMTGSAPNMSVASIAIDDGGAGYVIAPYVLLTNSELDPNGCFDPSAVQNAVKGSGFYVPAYDYWPKHTALSLTTDPVAVFCATVNSTFAIMWLP